VASSRAMGETEATAVGWMRGVIFDAADPPALAAFWSGMLGLGIDPKLSEPPGWLQLDGGRGGVVMGFQPVADDGGTRQRIRLDIEVPELDGPTERAVALGATYLRAVHFRPGEEHRVFTDPEGNEFNLVLPFPVDGLDHAES